MLRMIGGELRKLLTLRILILLAVLLAADLVMSVIYQKEQAEIYQYDTVKEHIELLRTIEEARTEDADAVDAYYAELCAEYETQYQIWFESTLSSFAEDESTFEFIAPYTYSADYNDYEALNIYFSTVNDYPALLQRIIDQTKANAGLLEALGISSTNKASAYQVQLAEIYEGLLENNETSVHLTLGWNEWFGYSYGMLLIFLAALLLVLQSGLCDRDTGMEVILRTTRRGRWQRGFAKAGAFFVALTAIVLIARIVELAVYGCALGLTSLFHAIQNVRCMTYSPFAMTIMTGALLKIVGLILSAFCFSMVCLVCTALVRNAFVSIALGGGLIAGNLLLYWFDLGWYYQFLDVFSLASGDLLVRPPDVVHITMGKSLYPYSVLLYCLIATWLIPILMFTTGAIRPKLKARKLRGLIWGRKPTTVKHKPVKLRTLRCRPIGLFAGEFAKKISPITIVLLIALIAFHGVQNYATIRSGRSDGEGKILGLIELYGNHITDDSLKAMNEHLAEDEALVAGVYDGQYVSDYLSGAISSDEYTDYRISKAQAQAEVSVLSELVSHCTYLRGLEEAGIATELFYDGGFLTLFGRNFDPGYYLMIVLLCASAFTSEYGSDGKNGLAFILRAAPRGRKPVFMAKMFTSVLIAATMGLLLNLFDFIVFVGRFGTTGMGAPLVCIEQYATFPSSITVGGYMAVYFGIRILAGILLALFITSLSCLIPSVKLNLPITMALTLLPMALTYLGLSICKYFDYTAFLDGDRLWLLSWEAGSAALLVGFVAVTAVITTGLTAASYRKFCK